MQMGLMGLQMHALVPRRSAEFVIAFNKGIDAGVNLLEACLAVGIVQGKVSLLQSAAAVLFCCVALCCHAVLLCYCFAGCPADPLDIASVCALLVCMTVHDCGH
jgi:hypothetical protein